MARIWWNKLRQYGNIYSCKSQEIAAHFTFVTDYSLRASNEPFFPPIIISQIFMNYRLFWFKNNHGGNEITHGIDGWWIQRNWKSPLKEDQQLMNRQKCRWNQYLSSFPTSRSSHPQEYIQYHPYCKCCLYLYSSHNYFSHLNQLCMFTLSVAKNL